MKAEMHTEPGLSWNNVRVGMAVGGIRLSKCHFFNCLCICIYAFCIFYYTYDQYLAMILCPERITRGNIDENQISNAALPLFFNAVIQNGQGLL